MVWFCFTFTYRLKYRFNFKFWAWHKMYWFNDIFFYFLWNAPNMKHSTFNFSVGAYAHFVRQLKIYWHRFYLHIPINTGVFPIPQWRICFKHLIIVILSYVFVKLLLMYISVNSVRSHEIRLAPGRDIIFFHTNIFLLVFFSCIAFSWCFLMMVDITRKLFFKF